MAQHSTHPGGASRVRRRALLGTAVLAVLVALAGLAAYLTREGRSPPPILRRHRRVRLRRPRRPRHRPGRTPGLALSPFRRRPTIRSRTGRPPPKRAAGVVHVRRQLRWDIKRRPYFSLPKGRKTREDPLPANLALRARAHFRWFPSTSCMLPWRNPEAPTTPLKERQRKPITVDLILTS